MIMIGQGCAHYLRLQANPRSSRMYGSGNQTRWDWGEQPDNSRAYIMGIFDLPNELLLLIAENLAVSDLFHFRSASQRHHRSLPRNFTTPY